MEFPEPVLAAITRLETAGFSCHAVGGCVRDSLLGLVPHDWDLTTNALPEQVMAVFAKERVIPSGLRHGTVTVMMGEMPLEITTYRVEGAYRDHRHPETVRFVSHITEDLRRRDFTVNAMAWAPCGGLVDPFGGAADLKNGVLRCVGTARERFDEDALRILRALRFASVYGFAVEEKTADAMLLCAPLLCRVAPERLQTEINRLLTGSGAGRVLQEYAEVLHPLLPELQAMAGVPQYNRYHDKDVWGHTVAAMEASPPLLAVRLALLFHDCGKPYCLKMLNDGYGHFPNHPAIGAEIAKRALQRLRYDRKTTETVVHLIQHHDDAIPDTDEGVRYCLYQWGEQQMRYLLAVKEADCAGHAPSLPPMRCEEIRRIRERMNRVISEGQCFSLSQLAITGNDVKTVGKVHGPVVGMVLRHLLERVMNGELANERKALLAEISVQKDLIISGKPDTIEK